jgi:hypothetical protein
LIFTALGDIILERTIVPRKRSEMMRRDTHSKKDVNPRTDLLGTFRELRENVEKAQSKEELTELYKRSIYMILMTHSTPVNEKFDKDVRRRRETTEREFARTVRMINQRAKKLGVEADYNENWESLATNGYETEGENLLEAESTVGIVKE